MVNEFRKSVNILMKLWASIKCAVYMLHFFRRPVYGVSSVPFYGVAALLCPAP